MDNDPEVFTAALCAPKRGMGELKGAKVTNRIWLPREKHGCTYGNQAFFLPHPRGVITITHLCQQKVFF